MRSSLVLSFLFISSSTGVTLVVVCSVVLYLSKKCDNLSCMVPFSIFSIPSLKALTACPACPFEAGWYGDTLVCFSNSALVKLGQLSLTMVSRKPWVTKISLNFAMLAADVVLRIMWTSIHLECASITT